MYRSLFHQCDLFDKCTGIIGNLLMQTEHGGWYFSPWGVDEKDSYSRIDLISPEPVTIYFY